MLSFFFLFFKVNFFLQRALRSVIKEWNNKDTITQSRIIPMVYFLIHNDHHFKFSSICVWCLFLDGYIVVKIEVFL